LLETDNFGQFDYSWQYHNIDFSSVQSLTARHRNANSVLPKTYL